MRQGVSWTFHSTFFQRGVESFLGGEKRKMSYLDKDSPSNYTYSI